MLIAASGRAGLKFHAGPVLIDLAASFGVPLYASASDGATAVSGAGFGQLLGGFGVSIGQAW